MGELDLLLFASLLITVGRLADTFGRIASRTVQAIGASRMLPSSIAVISVLFEGRQRAITFGMGGAVFGGAAGLGALLAAGWQDFSWRWAFLINVPVGIVAAIMVLRTVPENLGIKGFDTGRGLAVRDRPRPHRLRTDRRAGLRLVDRDRGLLPRGDPAEHRRHLHRRSR